jgi:hypothetical protein
MDVLIDMNVLLSWRVLCGRYVSYVAGHQWSVLHIRLQSLAWRASIFAFGQL